MIKVLKHHEKKLALALFFCFSQERITMGRLMKTYLHLLYISYLREISKMLNVTSKYFCIFTNTPPASWVVHKTRDFLRFYSCSRYSSMIRVINIIFSASSVHRSCYLCDFVVRDIKIAEYLDSPQKINFN